MFPTARRKSLIITTFMAFALSNILSFKSMNVCLHFDSYSIVIRQDEILH